MKEITSATANKLLKTYEEEKNYLLAMESSSSTYTLAEGEKELKPEYNYEATAKRLDELDSLTRKIKHGLNIFNTTTMLPDMGITVDEALVKMSQLNRKKVKLDVMRKRLPKARVSNGYCRSNMIEYEYVNYDLDMVMQDYIKVSKEVMDIQLQLDVCNQTNLFQLDI